MLEKVRIKEAMDKFNGLKIVVVGDLMLDRYIWGKVGRISPEAPVPVVEVTEEAMRPGGAGNVVLNLLSLGAECRPVGVMGDDLYGAELTDLLANEGAVIKGIVCDSGRPTTVKTRVIAGGQHVVRVDKEVSDNVTTGTEDRIIERLKEAISGADALLMQDYDKGSLTERTIRAAIDMANEENIPITVDPKRRNFFEYMNVTVFKPNLSEAANALGWQLGRDTDVERAGGQLLANLQAENVLITRGPDGMSLFGMGQTPVHIPTRARKISDVSGAGDTVISTLTIALAAGLDRVESSILANKAAGYVVGQVGVVPVTKEALLDGEGD